VEKQIIELLKGFTVSGTLFILNACKVGALRKRYLSEKGLIGTVGSKLLVLVSEFVSFPPIHSFLMFLYRCFIEMFLYVAYDEFKLLFN
jgi:hypothetical protein